MQRVIEALEARIAPAAVITYTEADGDQITVTTSAKVSNDYFEGLASYDIDGNLAQLDLNDSIFRNTNLTVTVVAGTTGNGKASIDRIEASGVDLKNVIINGDLGGISVGDSNYATPAVSKLQVNDLGFEDGGSDSYFGGGAKTVKILGDLVGDIYTEGGSVKTISITGSVGQNGDIEVRKIGTLTVGGDMGGEVYAETIRSIRIAGDLVGTEPFTGLIFAETIKSVRIGGSILGGDSFGEFPEDGSGGIGADVIGSVVVGGDIRGGSGANTGYIYADDNLGKVIVKGSVIGGSGDFSGIIESEGDAELIRIDGDLVAGDGEMSGSIALIERDSYFDGETETFEYYPTGVADKIVIGGSLVGSQEVLVEEELTFVLSGTGAGAILAEGIGSLRIGGNVEGGLGLGSGSVSGYDLTSAYIGGSIIGGAGDYSGSIGFDGIGSIRVIGSVLGGTGVESASIVGHSGIGSVKIGGHLGGDADGSGSIASPYGLIDSITIGDGVSNTGNGITGIYAEGEIGRVAITGDVIGGAYGTLGIRGGYNSSSSFVPSIGSVSIKGNVTNFLIEAGLELDGAGEFAEEFVNADASIGSVNITGDVVTSSIVAGVGAGEDGIYGTSDDDRAEGELNVYSRIASVVIGGTVTGTPTETNALDGYGIVAEHIIAAKINGLRVGLETGAINDTLAQLLGTTGDFRLVELAAIQGV